MVGKLLTENASLKPCGDELMRQAICRLRDRRADQGQHAGLLLQRYLCEHATGEDGNPEEKRAILGAAIRAAQNDDVQALYSEAYDRWKQTLPKGTCTFERQIDGRMIVGLGSENVLETGITLHHTFGMPIIPGSAVKGLAAHYCNQIFGSADESFKKPSPEAERAYHDYLKGKGPKPDDNHHRLLFGNTDDSGCVTFHDAWYVPGSARAPLCLDVMTPHHPRWLDGSAPPTDFDSPTPVPFLSVIGTFCFALSWNGPEIDPSGAEKWLAFTRNLLQRALADWGIGSKTTNGYGRLVEPGKTAHTDQASTTEEKPLPEAGAEVEAVLLEEKTKKGRWKARHLETGISGPIQNSDAVPQDKKPKDKVRLIVASSNRKEIAFLFPNKVVQDQSSRPPADKKKGKPPHKRQQ